MNLLRKYFMLMMCFLFCCCVVCSCNSSKSGATKAPESNFPEKSDGSQASLPATKLEKFTAPLQEGDEFTFGGNFIGNDNYNFILTKENNSDGTKESIEVVRPIVKQDIDEMKKNTVEIGTFATGEKLFLCIIQSSKTNNPGRFVLFSGNDTSCVQGHHTTKEEFGVFSAFLNVENRYVLKHNYTTPKNEKLHLYWLKKKD